MYRAALSFLATFRYVFDTLLSQRPDTLPDQTRPLINQAGV